MSKKLIFILAITWILSSCSVYRTISFNADHSGNMDSKVDITGLITMMGENGGGGIGDVTQLESSKTLLENVSGITNVKVTYDTTGILYTSYDFANVEALTEALAAGGNSMSMLVGTSSDQSGKAKITFKGKKFYMEEVDKKTLKSLQTDERKKDMADMEMMMTSSQINTTINFPSAVKKVSYKNATITNDKTVSFAMPLKDYFSKDYKPLTVIIK